MADFQKALAEILKDEGPYDKDPSDPGGETCFGIDARSNPAWAGWPLVHDLLKAQVAKNSWSSNAPLMALVSASYKATWDKFILDKIQSEVLSLALFGAAVNQGPYRAANWLQLALCAMDHDVSVNGSVDAATLAACNCCDAVWLTRLFDDLRRAAYITTAAHQPATRKFLKGWYNRLAAGA